MSDDEAMSDGGAEQGARVGAAAGEPGPGSGLAGGDEEMIYMEYIEVWGAISQYKYPNPYIPLQKKVEDMFVNIGKKGLAISIIKL